eukprot:ANDGO_02354.mRNA.1 Regulator of telomere elongation helicase 1 homolog
MYTYDILGVSVDFPYEAYPTQIQFMSSVMDALSGRRNALLESPTGTGKTLCLLCAVLAWRIHRRMEIACGDPGATVLVPKVIYASRTHSQLSQVVRELRKTSYGWTSSSSQQIGPELPTEPTGVKISVLGSREQLCVNPTIKDKKGHELTMACLEATSKHRCEYYSHYQDRKVAIQDLVDIEDLAKVGEEHRICPYYLSRESASLADTDLVLVPYNYIIDPHIRATTDLSLSDSIIIFDEAHNLGDALTAAASFEFSAYDISNWVMEMDRVVRICIDNPGAIQGFDIPDASLLKVMCKNFENAFIKHSSAAASNSSREDAFHQLPDIFQIFTDAGINFQEKTEDCLILLGFLDNAVKLLESDDTKRKPALSKMIESLRIVYKVHAENLAQYYRVALRKDANYGLVVMFMCLHPGAPLRDIARCVPYVFMFASGTLSPMDEYASEMGLEFPIRLENSHVVQNSQVRGFLMQQGPSGVSMRFTFASRGDPNIVAELARSLLNIARMVPDGALVFFPSYAALNSFVEHLRSSGAWTPIQKEKPIYYESKEKSAGEILQEYRETVKSGRGAFLFAVARGKISEGLDFSDECGRAVVLAGIPFPNLQDPKVKMKHDYMGTKGKMWYFSQAARAVNQAIGRVIRHKDDWGVIVFADERYSEPEWKGNLLSRWLRDFIRPTPSFGSVVRSIKEFMNEPKPSLSESKKKGDEAGSKRIIRVSVDKRSAPPSVGAAASVVPLIDLTAEDRAHLESVNKDWKRGRRHDGSLNLGELGSMSQTVHVSSDNSLPPILLKRGPVSQNLKAFVESVKEDQSSKGAGKLKTDAPDNVADLATIKPMPSMNARNFLESVKSILSLSDYASFRQSLLTIRKLASSEPEWTADEKGNADIKQCLKSAYNLLRLSVPLLQEFRLFLPKQFRPVYDVVVADESVSTTNTPNTSKTDMLAARSAGGKRSVAETPGGPISILDHIQGKRSRVDPAPAANASVTAAALLSSVTAASSLGATSVFAKKPKSGQEPRPADSEVICPCCYQPPRKPFVAKCKHACCYICWEKWLKHHTACPMCRAPVTMGSLQQVYLL